MKLQWHYPEMKYGFNPPAVYRMDFDNGFFYIGSSLKVKTRWVLWRTNFKRDIFQSKMMEESIKGATSVTCSILQIFDTKDEKFLKEQETKHLINNFNDPLFLNRTPNGFDNSGRKPVPEHLRKPIKEKRPYVRKGKFIPDRKYVWSYSKPVVQIDLQGKFIKSHKSIADAAREVNVNDSTMQEHIKRYRVLGIGGYVFREIGGLETFEIINRKHKNKNI